MVKHSKIPKFPFGPAATQAPSDAAASGDTTPDLSEELDTDEDERGLRLADHFLIAMPSMLDPVFGGSVIYLCEHNLNGALGVIINKPTDMTLDILLDRIDLKLDLEIMPNGLPPDKQPIMFGGPVQVERGFVLHVPQARFSSMTQVTDAVALTTSKDILEALAAGHGPQQILVTLGCAGWGAGQLEDEIARNGWLTVRADPAIMFDMPVEQRFAAAMKLLGIDPMMLSGEAGHA